MDMESEDWEKNKMPRKSSFKDDELTMDERVVEVINVMFKSITKLNDQG